MHYTYVPECKFTVGDDPSTFDISDFSGNKYIPVIKTFVYHDSVITHDFSMNTISIREFKWKNNDTAMNLYSFRYISIILPFAFMGRKDGTLQ